jgi:hypothetical protein
MQAVLTNGAFTLFRDAIPQIEFSDQITTDLCSSVSQAATPDMLSSKRECNRLQLTEGGPSSQPITASSKYKIPC